MSDDSIKLLKEFMFDYSLSCKRAGEALGGYSEATLSRWRAGKIKIAPAALLLIRLVYQGKVAILDARRLDD
jgi:hypothetical protein